MVSLAFYKNAFLSSNTEDGLFQDFVRGFIANHSGSHVIQGVLDQ
jgi:hypothetical protein